MAIAGVWNGRGGLGMSDQKGELSRCLPPADAVGYAQDVLKRCGVCLSLRGLRPRPWDDEKALV
jgi:hypothetical protein